jgi:sarcosine oxidase
LKTFDVIIVGLGAMGSAAVYHLAKRGVRVLGLDRFRPPHTLGSSHGQTRIIREAYFEHPAYVPLVQRAYVLWEELAHHSGTQLFLQTGGLMIGTPQSAVLSGARLSAETHRLPFEVVSAEEIQKRFPALRPAENMIGILEPRAGILFPEKCIAAHLQQAAGAELHYEEPVLHWKATAGSVEVMTDKDTYSASKLVLSAGSWLKQLVPELRLVVERQVLFWFASSRPELFQLSRCPIHLWEHTPSKYFYGFPDLGTGAKVAGHHEGEITHPDKINRTVSQQEIAHMQRLIAPFLPSLTGPCLESVVCMYTNTPDEHFLIDHHPSHPRVLLVSPCSGHGFKFSAAIGEVVADLIVKGQCGFDLSLFRLRSERRLLPI